VIGLGIWPRFRDWLHLQAQSRLRARHHGFASEHYRKRERLLIFMLFLATAIFDMPEKKCKCGIRVRSIKPHLSLIDPLNVLSMPRNVEIYTGFDILSHALESFTNKPYYEVLFKTNKAGINEQILESSSSS
jgi:hypothetical protein